MSLSGTGTGALSGAAQGAAAGSYFGPWGTVIGGIIGGVAGTFSGGMKDKASKNQRRAQQVQAQREQNVDTAQYVQMLRQARMARADSAVASYSAGDIGGSLGSNAASSIGSQLGYSMNTLAEDQRLFEQYAHYMRKAGEAVDRYANTTAFIDGTAKVVTSYGQYQQAKKGLGGAGEIKVPQ